MSRKLLLFFLMCSFWAPLKAQNSPQAVFDEANTLLEQGNLNEAMNMYRSILANGQVSGPLFLNMGLTAVQLDSMGLAKYYLMKSLEFNSTQPQAEQALEYVNSQFSRQSAVLPKLPWDRAVDWINNQLGVTPLFIAGFILTLIGLILLYGNWLGYFHLNKLSTYVLSLVIGGTMVAALAFYADYVDQRYDEAVLIDNSQRVYETSSSDGTLVSIAYEGYELTVDNWKSSDQENWLYVRLGNGQYGWVSQEGIRIL